MIRCNKFGIPCIVQSCYIKLNADDVWKAYFKYFDSDKLISKSIAVLEEQTRFKLRYTYNYNDYGFETWEVWPECITDLETVLEKLWYEDRN